MEDSLASLKNELNLLKEKYVFGESVDPVFEGTVRQFLQFDNTLQEIYRSVDVFIRSSENMCAGIMQLSETMGGRLLLEGLKKGVTGTRTLAFQEDPLIASDTLKMREAANSIARADAPHSSLAKLKRDIEYNVVNPLRLHLINNRSLKGTLELRRRKLLEFTAADKAFDECKSKRLRQGDRKYDDCKSARDISKREFLEIDREVFEWLYTLEEYKGDVLDSALQTLKYLQYEFFASSAHAVANVLPTRMEFRPMVEMTPQFLERQIQLSMEEEDLDEGDKDSDENTSSENELRGIGGGRHGPLSKFSDRLLDKMQKDETMPWELEKQLGFVEFYGYFSTLPISTTVHATGSSDPLCRNVLPDITNKSDTDAGSAPTSEPAVAVDPLSLCSLMSQGFEESSARKALRHCNNDTQAALDYLIGQQHSSMGRAGRKASSQSDVAGEDEEGVPHTEVRMPTTTKRIEKLKETKKRVMEKREERRRLKDEMNAAMKEKRKEKSSHSRRRRRRHRRRRSEDKNDGSSDESERSSKHSSHRETNRYRSGSSRTPSSSSSESARRSNGRGHHHKHGSRRAEHTDANNNIPDFGDLLEMQEPALRGPPLDFKDFHERSDNSGSDDDLLQLSAPAHNSATTDAPRVPVAQLMVDGPLIGGLDSPSRKEPLSFDPLVNSDDESRSVHKIGGFSENAQKYTKSTPLPLLTGDEASAAVARARQKVPQVSSGSSSEESDEY